MKLFRSMLCIAALLMQGCVIHIAPDESNPVPLKFALQVLENDLHNAAPVTLGNIDTVQGRESLSAAIFESQCANKTANPVLPVISGPVSLSLQGSISKTPGVSGSIQAVPSVGLQYTVTKGQQQQVTIPVTFVSTTDLPNFYLGQQLANLAGLSDRQKANDVRSLLKQRDQLRKIVTEQVNAYESKENSCKGGAPPHPIFPETYQIR